jgi:hypothetical protein
LFDLKFWSQALCVRKKEGSAGFEHALSGLEVEDLNNYTIAASIPTGLISTAHIISFIGIHN